MDSVPPNLNGKRQRVIGFEGDVDYLPEIGAIRANEPPFIPSYPIKPYCDPIGRFVADIIGVEIRLEYSIIRRWFEGLINLCPRGHVCHRLEQILAPHRIADVYPMIGLNMGPKV